MFNKYLLLAIFIIAVIQPKSFAQFELLSTGERFNERGYSTASSISVDGNEIISDYDGNFSYKLSRPFMAGRGIEGEFTLILNNNVEHKIFPYNYFGNPVQRIGSVNAPEWILGYMGFAVQVLNFETNFHLSDYGTQSRPLKGDQVPKIIPGYSYCNSIVDPKNWTKKAINLRCENLKLTGLKES